MQQHDRGKRALARRPGQIAANELAVGARVVKIRRRDGWESDERFGRDGEDGGREEQGGGRERGAHGGKLHRGARMGEGRERRRPNVGNRGGEMIGWLFGRRSASFGNGAASRGCGILEINSYIYALGRTPCA